MSLKSFHVLFISLSFVLALGFGVWCVWYNPAQGGSSYVTAGVISFLVAGVLVVYGAWFLRKLRTWDEDSAMRKTTSLRGLIVVASGLLIPSLAEACPVCYGASESSWIDASQAAVWLLLAVTVGVQVAFATFFIRLRKRTKTMQARRSEMELVGGRGAA